MKKHFKKYCKECGKEIREPNILCSKCWSKTHSKEKVRLIIDEHYELLGKLISAKKRIVQLNQQVAVLKENNKKLKLVNDKRISGVNKND